MRKIYAALPLLAMLFSAYTEVSDFVKLKKTKSGDYEERYFVYKEQPQIKQGQYVKIYTTVFNTQRIVELGNYELDQKTGMWLDFYYLFNNNMLRSYGNYVQGLKQGEWTYFFRYDDFDSTVRSVLAGNMVNRNGTTLFVPKSDRDICAVNIDTTNVRIMETGSYEDDKKIGVWEYFSSDGKLLQKYDHSAGKLLENHASPDEFMIYLGGLNRFSSYQPILLPEKLVMNVETSTSLTFEVKVTGFELLSSNGDPSLIKEVKDQLNKTQNDWILIDPEAKKSLRFNFEFKIDPENLKKSYTQHFETIELTH
jgi:antitoxin component YwqK of YwqJK toxin-antitoxin module